MTEEGNDRQNKARSLRRMAVFVGVMLPVVIGLGIWQLQRADYKQTLADAYFDKLGGLPVSLSDPVLPEGFTRVRVRGEYSDENMLLDNQVKNARQGFWVYTPFTSAAATWLVNRGWYQAPRTRTDQPDIPAAPAGEVNLVAVVWPDTGMLPLFGEQAVQRLDDRTLLMQRLDFAALRDELGNTADENLMPAELRLEAGQPGALDAVPQTMGFGVERHQGYAFQWFGLAVALVAGYFFYRRSFT